MIVILIILCVIAGLVVYTMIAGLVYKFLKRHTNVDNADCEFFGIVWLSVIPFLPIYYLIVCPLRWLFNKAGDS